MLTWGAALRVALGVTVVAACGGRVDPASMSDGSAPFASDCADSAVSYCQANGCPLTGPATSTAAAVDSWCAASPALAPRVTGFGTCTTPSGQEWAIDVRTSDATGGTVYLLYDPASARLVSVSTLEPAAGSGDGGPIETDYGSCGEHLGIITCAGVAFTCAP
jgi:hypothetical protein